MRWNKFKALLKQEDGISLVEILIAVTIMSLITVFIMSYYVGAMEKSADQSRRVIAANLARMKTAELRHIFGQPEAFIRLQSYRSSIGRIQSNADIPDALSDLIGDDSDASDEFKISFDAWEHPDQTTYRYLIDFTEDDRMDEIQLANPLHNWPDYVIPIRVTVYWTANEVGEDDLPSAKFSVSYDTYIVKRGGD